MSDNNNLRKPSMNGIKPSGFEVNKRPNVQAVQQTAVTTQNPPTPTSSKKGYA